MVSPIDSEGFNKAVDSVHSQLKSDKNISHYKIIEFFVGLGDVVTKREKITAEILSGFGDVDDANVKNIKEYVSKDHGLIGNIKAYRKARRAVKEWKAMHPPEQETPVQAGIPDPAPTEIEGAKEPPLKTVSQQVDEFKSRGDYEGLAFFLESEKPANAEEIARGFVKEFVPDSQHTQEFFKQENPIEQLKGIKNLERELAGKVLEFEHNAEFSEEKKLFIRNYINKVSENKNLYKLSKQLDRIEEASKDFDAMVKDGMVSSEMEKKYDSRILSDYIKPFLYNKSECEDKEVLFQKIGEFNGLVKLRLADLPKTIGARLSEFTIIESELRHQKAKGLQDEILVLKQDALQKIADGKLDRDRVKDLNQYADVLFELNESDIGLNEILEMYTLLEKYRKLLSNLE